MLLHKTAHPELISSLSKGAALFNTNLRRNIQNVCEVMVTYKTYLQIDRLTTFNRQQTLKHIQML